jgi:hypothetical protein
MGFPPKANLAPACGLATWRCFGFNCIGQWYRRQQRGHRSRGRRYRSVAERERDRGTSVEHLIWRNVTRDEVMTVLEAFAVKEKKPYKASLALSHLKRLRRWAVLRGIVAASILDGVASDFERHSHERVDAMKYDLL